MRVLSVVACSRLSERIARQAGGQLDRGELLARLCDLDIDHDRAAAGVRLALTVGRLEAVEGGGGMALRARAVLTPDEPAREAPS